MVSVDYADLRAAQPQTYGHACEAWTLLRERFDGYVTDYTDNVQAKVNGSGWTGNAAYVAHIAVLDGLARLDATSRYLEGVCILLANAAIGIAEAQAMVDDAVAEARAAGLTVDDQGAVHRPTPLLPTPTIDATTASVQTKIVAALTLAAETQDAFYTGLGNAYKFIDGTWLRDAYQDLEDIKDLRPVTIYRYGDDGVDPPLRPWNVAEANARDQWLHTQMLGATIGLEVTGRPHAASMFKHWLEGSGTPVEVSPAEMLDDIPAFRAEVESFVESQGPGSFDSGWNNGAWLNEAENRVTDAQQDWYYTFNDFRWRVVGTSSVIDGEPSVQYTVEVYKNYQFNPDRTPISIPSLPIDIEYEQERLMRLHEVGLSRDFVATGSSHFGGAG
jgi:hypothetical protein